MSQNSPKHSPFEYSTYMLYCCKPTVQYNTEQLSVLCRTFIPLFVNYLDEQSVYFNASMESK